MAKVKLESSLSNAVVKLFRKVNRVHNRALSELKLTAEQVHLLSVLWNKGRMTIGELQGLLSLSSGTIAGAIDRMEKKGLIKRVKSKEDKRVTYIEIEKTEKTERATIEQILAQTEKELFGNLTFKEREQLLFLINKIDV